MFGSHQRVSQLLLVGFVSVLAGCQLLPTPIEKQPWVTLEALEISSQQLQSSFQRELAALEERQLSNQQLQSKELQLLKLQLKKYQQEHLHYHRQHTFQLEQLGNLIEPSLTKSHLTEVVQDDGKMLLGEYEWVHLPAQHLVLPARIDSGANTSSLHAINLQQFERDGKAWVRFETHYQPVKDELALKVEVEAPLVRKVNVIQASGIESRPVISLPLQLGALTQNVEFTLTNRENLTFPVLLGRRFFMDIAVIDVSKTYVQGKPEIVVPQQLNEEATSKEAEL